MRKSELNDHALFVKISLCQTNRSNPKLIKSFQNQVEDALSESGQEFKMTSAGRVSVSLILTLTLLSKIIKHVTPLMFVAGGDHEKTFVFEPLLPVFVCP